MIRKLLVVALSAFAICMVSLAVAWAIGGKEMVRSGGFTLDLDDEKNSGPHIRKGLAFDPDLPLVLEAPVDLEYTRGDKTEMTISGNSKLVGAVRWVNGKLTLDGKRKSHSGTLTIKITAPKMPRVELSGPANIELNDLRQPLLDIDIAGAGNIEANGAVDTLKVNAGGAGNLSLEDLIAKDGNIDMAGFGNADLSVTGRLDLAIAGAGNVSLHRKPRELHSDIAGLGNVSHDY